MSAKFPRGGAGPFLARSLITTLYFFSIQRRLWRGCAFAQAHLSLRHSIEISCAGSNGDLCTVYKSSECCGEAAPATMAHLGNNQCSPVEFWRILGGPGT